LEHCDRGGVPLDFITFHAKGRPEVVDGHVRMGLAKNVQDVTAGLAVLGDFPKFGKLPVILSESDPEGCAACSARVYPQNAYRNGPLYAAYTAAMVSHLVGTRVTGMLTWAFLFEGQPYFEGFRTLATNGIDKPVLNVFRMLGLLQGDRVAVESSGGEGVDALAVRSEHGVRVLAWHYQADDVAGPDAEVRVEVSGVPATRMVERHYRIDGQHSNAYRVWKEMGSPQEPDAGQYARLEAAGQLGLLESPRWVSSVGGRVEMKFGLPRQAVSLIELSW
jgi:xylan 1,4-beta-xylosidase